MEELEYFDMIGHSLDDVKKSKVFGTVCYKTGRRPFILFEKGEIVCKLYDDVKKRAMSIAGAHYFNPMNQGKGMTNWVQIPYSAKEQWEEFAIYALEFVKLGK